MIGLVAVAFANPHVLRVPFPTTRLYPDVPDRVCLRVHGADPVVQSTVDDGNFRASCRMDDVGRLELCLELMTASWPERVASLSCGEESAQVEMVPVPAFDPADSLEDGVRIVRNVTRIQAAFHAGDLPNAAGILEQGECGVQDGMFWVVAQSRAARQSCVLVLPVGEMVVPIRLVGRL